MSSSEVGFEDPQYSPEKEQEEVTYGLDGTYGTWLRSVLKTGHLSLPALDVATRNHTVRDSAWRRDIEAAKQRFYPERFEELQHQIPARIRHIMGLFYKLSRGNPDPLEDAFASGEVTGDDVDDMMSFGAGGLQEALYDIVEQRQ